MPFRNILCGAALSLMLVGCGGDPEKGKRTASKPTSAPSAESQTPTPEATEAPVEDDVDALGYEVVLEGTASSDDGTSQELGLAVKVSKLIDPAKNSYISASSVEPGTRWVRVLVRMSNNASETYKIADGQFTLVDEQGEEGFENLSSAPWHALGNGKLLPGDTRRGWLGFLIKKGNEPDELRWEPIIGADTVYRWDLSKG